MYEPIISQRNLVAVSIEDGEITVTDGETEEEFTIPFPEDEELTQRIKTEFENVGEKQLILQTIGFYEKEIITDCRVN
jgi:hypothetical protein